MNYTFGGGTHVSGGMTSVKNFEGPVFDNIWKCQIFQLETFFSIDAKLPNRLFDEKSSN